MRIDSPPVSASHGPPTNPPADPGPAWTPDGAGATPSQIFEQAELLHRRAADLRQRADAARQRALALTRESAALLLAAQQVRLPISRKELLARSEEARLWARMESNAVIEQAKGILMAQHGCDPEAAFDLLRQASQRSNVPVRTLAARIVAKVADGSWASPQQRRRAS